MKKWGSLGAFFLILLGIVDIVKAEEGWKEVQNKDGVLVEERKVFDSPMHQFRGSAVIPFPAGRIMGLLNDRDPRLNWMPNLEERVLEQENNHIYLYQLIRSRFVADRDVILHIQAETRLTEKAIYLTFESVHSTPHPEKNQPEIRGVVRMPFVKGYWKLKPTRQGQWTEVEYFVHSNPGGRIPSWMANWVSKNMPYKSLQILKEHAALRSYPEFEKMLQEKADYKSLFSP